MHEKQLNLKGVKLKGRLTTAVIKKYCVMPEHFLFFSKSISYVAVTRCACCCQWFCSPAPCWAPPTPSPSSHTSSHGFFPLLRWEAGLCLAWLWYAMLCYAIFCYDMFCYDMLCYARLCYAFEYSMLSYATLHKAISWYIYIFMDTYKPPWYTTSECMLWMVRAKCSEKNNGSFTVFLAEISKQSLCLQISLTVSVYSTVSLAFLVNRAWEEEKSDIKNAYIFWVFLRPSSISKQTTF